jgi:hypothetical protein
VKPLLTAPSDRVKTLLRQPGSGKTHLLSALVKSSSGRPRLQHLRTG